MLETLFRSRVREQVLLYILARGEGYSREIARFIDSGLDSVQKQLTRLSEGGVLARRKIGRTILFSFNDSYPFIVELKALLESSLRLSSKPWAEELRIARSHRTNEGLTETRYRRRRYKRGP